MTPTSKPPLPAPDAPGAPSASRRRLLLGATGALPSVLTLASGAAAAAGSTLSCLTPSNRLAAPTRFQPQDDGWLRAQVNVAAYENRPAYCITTPSNACVDGSQHAVPGSQWVVDGNNLTAGTQNNLQVLPGQRAYALVYVDQSGNIMTLDPRKSGNLTPVMDSCWSSLVGGRTSNLG